MIILANAARLKVAYELDGPKSVYLISLSRADFPCAYELKGSEASDPHKYKGRTRITLLTSEVGPGERPQVIERSMAHLI